MATSNFQCECGAALAASRRGQRSDCPRCGQSVFVPDADLLQARNDELYPELRHTEKIQAAIRDRIRPFDGSCSRCNAEATIQIPIDFVELRQQEIAGHGGVRFVLGGIDGVLEKTEEAYETTTIPLILCEQCAAEFESTRPRAITLWLRLLAIAGSVACLIHVLFETLLVTIVATIIVLGRSLDFHAKLFRESRKVPDWLAKWVALIPSLPNAVDEALDFEITVGRPRQLSELRQLSFESNDRPCTSRD